MSTRVRHIVSGRSVEGRPIRAYVRPGSDRRKTIVFAGMHGDEPKSVYVAQRLIEVLDAYPGLGCDRDWVIVPIVNPDGYDRRKRRNANAVDINRNFPTANWTRTSPRSRMFGGEKPASEPETRTAIRIIQRCLSEPEAQARGSPTRRPAMKNRAAARIAPRDALGQRPHAIASPTVLQSGTRRVKGDRSGLPVRARTQTELGSALHARAPLLSIITIHSIDRRRHCNNYDGPAAAIARAMYLCNGYPVTKSIGYPTPGSFGTWAGRERRIPVITLELPSHHSAKRCWEDNRRAFFC